MADKLRTSLVVDEVGILRSNLSWATLTLRQVALILEMPSDQTMKDLPDWARKVMARLKQRTKKRR